MSPSCWQLTNAGDDVVVFYNDKASLAHLLDMMKAARDGVEDHSPLMYHISLVDLLAACAEGKNVYTEIKCTSLLPLEDVVSVVTHEDCITEVGPCIHKGHRTGRGGWGRGKGSGVRGARASRSRAVSGLRGGAGRGRERKVGKVPGMGCSGVGGGGDWAENKGRSGGMGESRGGGACMCP